MNGDLVIDTGAQPSGFPGPGGGPNQTDQPRNLTLNSPEISATAHGNHGSNNNNTVGDNNNHHRQQQHGNHNNSGIDLTPQQQHNVHQHSSSGNINGPGGHSGGPNGPGQHGGGGAHSTGGALLLNPPHNNSGGNPGPDGIGNARDVIQNSKHDIIQASSPSSLSSSSLERPYPSLTRSTSLVEPSDFLFHRDSRFTLFQPGAPHGFLRQHSHPIVEFPTKSGMQRHARDVHMLQEKAHKCEKCFKSFPSSQQLQQHMLVHTNIRKYKCQYCDKAFKQLSHVQQHHRRHTGERPYKCMIDECGKAFAQLSNLQQHQRNHENRKNQAERKPYLCTVCDRRFSTENSLNNHVTKLHAGMMMMRVPDRKCAVCGKEYQSDERYIRHIHKLHPEYWEQFSGGRPLEMLIPAREMYGSPREVQHREKKFSCTICHKAYSHETGYLKHMASHPENENLKMRLWSCPVCLKVFTKETYLERHMEMKLDPDHTRELVDFRKRLIERQNREQEVALLNEQQRRQRIAAGEPLPGTSGLHNLINAAPSVEQRDRLQNSLLNNDLNSGLGLTQNGSRSQLTPINLGPSRMSPTDFGGHRGSEPVSPLPLQQQRENGAVNNNGSVASPRNSNNSNESPQSSSAFLPSNFNSTIQSVVNNIMSSQSSTTYMGRSSTPLDSNGMLPPSSTPSRLSVDTHSPLGSPPPNRQRAWWAQWRTQWAWAARWWRST